MFVYGNFEIFRLENNLHSDLLRLLESQLWGYYKKLTIIRLQKYIRCSDLLRAKNGEARGYCKAVAMDTVGPLVTFD